MMVRFKAWMKCNRRRLACVLAAMWLLIEPCEAADQRTFATFLHSTDSVSADSVLYWPLAKRLTPADTLRLSTSSWEFQSIHLPWKVRLANGDWITGEILAGNSEALHMRLFGQVRLRLPWKVVSHIGLRPGDRELIAERFDDAATRQLTLVAPEGAQPPVEVAHGLASVSATPQPVRIVLPKIDGDFQWLMRLRIIGTASGSSGVRLGFESNEKSVLTVEAHPESGWSARRPESNEPMFRQPGSLTSEFQSLQLRQVSGRWYVSLDNRLICATAAPRGRLDSVSLHVTQPSVKLELDHVAFVVREHTSPTWPEPVANVDAIVGMAGETWWGTVRELGPDRVVWSDGQSLVRQNGRMVRGIVRRAENEPIPGRSLSGRHVCLELRSAADRPDLPGDHLTVALGASEGKWMLANHPLIGPLPIPRAAIRRVRQRFDGTYQLLDARQMPLSSQPQDASGEMNAGHFLIPTTACAAAYFSLEVSGLEPSGPETPPGSSALKSLRAGNGTLDLYLNDQRVGSFNELTSQPSLPGQFDRLRMKMAPALLIEGEHNWRIVRTPAGGARQRHAVTRIRNAALEWETPLP